jgi:hypothetical protein
VLVSTKGGGLLSGHTLDPSNGVMPVKNLLHKFDPRRVQPERGRALADTSVVFVCAIEIVKMAGTLIVPIAAILLFLIFVGIDGNNS